MISTLHGVLPLTVHPAEGVTVNMRGRAEICKVRGIALGQNVNVSIMLDTESGELLFFSPDMQAGTFRLGDLIAAQFPQQKPRREASHA